jgi:ankyrin repeat protein
LGYGHDASPLNAETISNIVSLLVAYHADVNASNRFGQTAVHWAALRNDPGALLLLLANKADVNAADVGGVTPLHNAVSFRRVSNVLLLLEHGANPNARDGKGMTPMDCLIALRNTPPSEPIDRKLEEMLISHGAVRPNAKPASGPDVSRVSEAMRKRYGLISTNSEASTNEVAAPEIARVHDVVTDGEVYHAATEAEAAEIRKVAALLREAPDLALAENGAARLGAAASADKLALAEFLLGHGAKVDDGTPASPPIHGASSNGHKSMVEMLLDHGAKVDAPGREGETALRLAAQKGFASIAEVLLSHGADVNAADRSGRTPLIESAFQAKRAMAELLLSRGAKVDARDLEGRTALHWTIASDSADVAEVLLKHGADLNATNNAGQTALHEAAALASVESARFLLDQNAPVGARDRDGNTPLILAVQVGQARHSDYTVIGSLTGQEKSSRVSKVIELLFAHGADVNATNRLGQTALHWAALLGASGPLDLLLANKASVDPRDNLHRTPLLNAVQARLPENVRTLLEHGADANGRDASGMTPMGSFADSSWEPLWFSVPRAISGGAAGRIKALLIAHGAVLRQP